MSDLELTGVQRRTLEQQARSTHDARVYRRTLALLQIADGQSVSTVAEHLRAGRRSVYRWLAAYRAWPRPEALSDKPGRGRPRLLGSKDMAALERWLRRRPADLGYWANDWTVPLLAEHLTSQSPHGLPTCSTRTLYRRLDDLDEAWKRPRHALPPDPDTEKKTPDPQPAHTPPAPQRRAL
jgi:transposase